MYAFNRLLIGLDLTLMDQAVIRYLSFICRLMQPTHLHFLNVQPQLDPPEDLRDEFPMFDDSVADHIVADMKAEVAEHFEDHARLADRMYFHVVEGAPRKEILRMAHEQEIDLLIVGRKQQQRGSGLVPSQVARKIGCSVLFVPEQTTLKLEHILVGCDFSAHAALAVQEAQLMQQRMEAPVQLTLQHIYQVPMGYYKTGRTEAQFAAIMRQHAEKRLRKFADQHDLDLSQAQEEFTYDHKKTSPAHLIKAYGHEQQVDLIIVAARGHNILSALLLGSVAEKLIKLDSGIPLLIIKQKDRSMSFQEMIDQI
jgi:nucleotide-binding universal stress UspA family protein